jgi:hypothetical protein
MEQNDYVYTYEISVNFIGFNPLKKHSTQLDNFYIMFDLETSHRTEQNR